MTRLTSNRCANELGTAFSPLSAAVPLTVTALEMTGGRVTHLRGSHHAGQPWRLALGDAIAAIESRRYSIAIRSGRVRCILVRRDDLERGFEARDRSGQDLVLALPVIAGDPLLSIRHHP